MGISAAAATVRAGSPVGTEPHCRDHRQFGSDANVADQVEPGHDKPRAKSSLFARKKFPVPGEKDPCYREKDPC